MTAADPRTTMFDMWPAFRAILAASAGTALLLAQLSLPNKDFWTTNSVLLYGCIGLLLVQELMIRAGDGWQSDAVRRYEKDVKAALNAALKATAERFGVPWDEVGVHVFMSRRRLVDRQLAKIAGVRMGSSPSLVRSSWRPGKGLIGLAWQSESLEAVDWQDVAGLARAVGKAKWGEQPAKWTFGLSWPEMQATFDYRGVVAYPMYDQRLKLVGCVTIDGPLPAEELATDTMREILNNVAVAVSAAGDPPYSVLMRR